VCVVGQLQFCNIYLSLIECLWAPGQWQSLDQVNSAGKLDSAGPKARPHRGPKRGARSASPNDVQMAYTCVR